MSKIEEYGSDYFANYFGAKDYFNNNAIIENYRAIARVIAQSLKPKTFLDVGCACGHFVAALRENGIAAWGVDAASVALSAASDRVAPYLGHMALPSCDLPENMPKRYDMVSCIEVLEHIPESDAEACVRTLTSFSDCVLFSSTPWNKEEPTHVNVQNASYWGRIFARFGFNVDFGLTPDFVSPQALLFKKGPVRGEDEWFDALDVIVARTRMFSEHEADFSQEIVRQKSCIDELSNEVREANAALAGVRMDLQAKDRILETTREAFLRQMSIDNQRLHDIFVRYDDRAMGLERGNRLLRDELDRLMSHISFLRGKMIESQTAATLAKQQLGEAQTAVALATRQLDEIVGSGAYRVACQLRRMARAFKVKGKGR